MIKAILIREYYADEGRFPMPFYSLLIDAKTRRQIAPEEGKIFITEIGARICAKENGIEIIGVEKTKTSKEHWWEESA